MVNNDVDELLKRYMNVENEIRLLQEDKKQIFEEFKDKVSPRAFKTALAAARNRSRLKTHEVSEYDQLVEIFEGRSNLHGRRVYQHVR